MRNQSGRQTLLLGFGLLILTFSIGSAAEPASEFLAGLRELEYYDIALEYLDKMQTSTTVPIEFKATILYEKGVTLVSASRSERNMTERQKVLDQAQSALEEFSKANENHHLVSSAKGQLANLLVERARMNIEKSKQKNTVPAQQDSLMTEARGWFDEARLVFEGSREDLKAKLEKFPVNPDPNNPNTKKLIKIRDQYRTDYLQARLLIPAIKEEKADTFPDGNEERKKLLTEASAGFAEVYVDYRTRIAGLYARMYQARCHTKMKDYKEALSLFGDIFEQDENEEAFRKLKLQGLILAIDCWLPANDKPLYNDAILKISPMIEKVRPAEARESDWLYLRLALARAYEAQGNDLADQKEKNVALANARREATFVAKYPSDYKRQAQELVARLGGLDLPEVVETAPKTFADARQKGKDAMDEWQTANLTVEKLTQQIAAESDAAKKTELETALAAAQKLVKETPAKSLGYFRLALELVDENTTGDDIDIVRYFLAFWYFTTGDFYDSALVGEFVARRNPSSAAASQCAQIALASYVQIYKTTKDKDPEFAKRRVIEIGDYTIKKWPDKPETVTAANTLIAFMVTDKRLEDAVRYLGMIPLDSPSRGAAELSTGQALWSAYLEGTRNLRDAKPDAATKAAEEKRLESVKNEAKSILKAGIERMRNAGVSEILLAGSLSLAQVYVDTNEPDLAIEMLEDEKIGALPFIKQKHPATQKKGFEVEAYKTALRAYISTSKPGANEKAQEMIEGLNRVMTDKNQLVATFVSLATAMKDQVDAIKDLDVKKTMASRFSTFLKNIRSNSDDLSIQMWAADSYSKLGETFSKLSPADAKAYFLEAVNGFDVILDKGTKTPGWLSAEVRTSVEMRKAATLRELGEYEKAISTFEEMLAVKSSMLNVQVEAARTYQAWAEKDKKYYINAIMGGVKKDAQGKPIIWGWGKLSQVTSKYYEQFKDVFHESRYNLALCTLQIGKSKTEKEAQKKDIGNARNAITLTEKLYADLGGDIWKPKYQTLLKEIDAELLKLK